METVIAESNNTIVVEGNHYFPPESIRKEFFEESATNNGCFRKGVASYYDVVANGDTLKDAGWYHPEPNKAAEGIRNYVAFWKSVKVVQ